MKKKILMFFIMFLCLPIITKALATNSSVDYSINVNVFYEDDCKDCTKLKNWLANYKKDDNRVNVNSFNIKSNKKLSSKVRDALNIRNNKTPFIVIGSNSFVGFNDKVKDELTKAIKAYEDEDEYCDVVLKVKTNSDVKDCISMNKGIYKQKNNNLMVMMVSFVSVCLVIILFMFSKRNKDIKKKAK